VRARASASLSCCARGSPETRLRFPARQTLFGKSPPRSQLRGAWVFSDIRPTAPSCSDGLQDGARAAASASDLAASRSVRRTRTRGGIRIKPDGVATHLVGSHSRDQGRRRRPCGLAPASRRRTAQRLGSSPRVALGRAWGGRALRLRRWQAASRESRDPVNRSVSTREVPPCRVGLPFAGRSCRATRRARGSGRAHR